MSFLGISGTEFGIRAVSQLFTAAQQPSFVLNIGVVVVVDPYNHVYGITPYPTMRNVPPIPAIALGARGNTRRGVQLQTSYYVGDVVLYIEQLNLVTDPVSKLAFIVGAAQPELLEPVNPEDLVSASRWDGDNLDEQLVPLFRALETRAGLNDSPPYMTGHGGIDMPPGAYEASGKLISLIADDYFAGIRATCAEILVSGMDRRIIERSMLRTISTLNTLDDTAILNTSTITTHKACGNVNDAWYNYVDEDDNEIKTKDGKGSANDNKLSARPTGDSESSDEPTVAYRDITQSGDILYGEHRVILSEDHKTPLYTDFLGLDGTRKIFSATRTIIGKRAGLKSIGYQGERLNVDESLNDKYPDTTNLDNPLTMSASTDWWVYPEKLDLDLNGYPDSFVNGDLGEYADKKPQVITDSLVEDKAIPLMPGCGYIEFQDDGGIKILDAWGSYILMSHGNVEIHAMNNLFMLSARDTLSFAGANRTDYANEDISIQAYNGDLRIKGGKYLRMRAGNTDAEGSIVLEAPDSIDILSATTNIQSLEVSITCENPLTKGSNLGGVFQVLAPTGSINLTADSIRQNASTISLTSDTGKKALVINSMVTVVGDIMLHGGLHSWRNNPTVTIMNRRGESTSLTCICGTYGRWTNEMEGIHVVGGVRAVQDVISTMSVVGGNVLTLHKQKELVQAQNPGTLGASVRNFSNERKPNTSNTEPVVTADVQDIEDKYFTFGKPSQACTYRLVTKLPSGNTNPNRGFKPAGGKATGEEYIYPGIEFWRSNGVMNYSVNPEGVPQGFITIPSANDNKKKG